MSEGCVPVDTSDVRHWQHDSELLTSNRSAETPTEYLSLGGPTLGDATIFLHGATSFLACAESDTQMATRHVDLVSRRGMRAKNRQCGVFATSTDNQADYSIGSSSNAHITVSNEQSNREAVLAERVVPRVAKAISEIFPDYDGDPGPYRVKHDFCFASPIFLHQVRPQIYQKALCIAIAERERIQNELRDNSHGAHKTTITTAPAPRLPDCTCSILNEDGRLIDYLQGLFERTMYRLIVQVLQGEMDLSFACYAGRLVDDVSAAVQRPRRWGLHLGTVWLPHGYVPLSENAAQRLMEKCCEIHALARFREMRLEHLETSADILKTILQPFEIAFLSGSLELLDPLHLRLVSRVKVTSLPPKEYAALRVALANAVELIATSQMTIDCTIEFLKVVNGLLRSGGGSQPHIVSQEQFVSLKKVENDQFMPALIEEAAEAFESGTLTFYDLQGVVALWNFVVTQYL